MTDAERTQLVELHLADAARVARRMKRRLPRHVDVEELEAAALAGLWKAAATFDPARSPWAVWMRRLMRLTVFDWLRETNGQQHRLALLFSAGQRRWKSTGEPLRVISLERTRIPDHRGVLQPSLAEADRRPRAAEAVEQADAVAVALSALSPREARLVSYYYLDDLTMREAAGRVGMSQSRACQIMPDLLARMRERLLLREKYG